jgi:energy-converting hydrogenase B subunit D
MILEIAMVLVVVLSIVAAEMKDLIHAIIVLGAADAIIAAVFFMMSAPDIAVTQAAVMAGLSTLIMMIAINRTRRMEEE